MRARHLLVLVAVAAACDSGSSTPVKRDGAAGASGSGGASATGGSAAGGVSGSGGASVAGGAGGGVPGTGGASGPGGAMGGTTGRGGANGTGGASGPGGRTGAPRDGGNDGLERLDGPAGTGGAGPGTGGSGGSRPDGGPDARPDVLIEVTRDAGPDTGFFKPSPVPDGGTCPFKGNVTYTLKASSDATADQQIKKAMDQALFYYNCYSNLTRALNVYYEPSVATADGNSNGTIRFGPSQYRTLRVAMHEMGHTFGIGTASNWNSFIDKGSGSSGPWTGKNGIAQRDALLPDHWQDTQRVLTADGHVFWPYGLSLDSDYKTEDDLIGHCMMVMAIRMDLGLK